MSDRFHWGLLGTASIADAFARGVMSGSGGCVHAVASRSAAKARAWADERGIPLAFGSYEELIGCREIDAVYIPLPNTLHAEWTMRALGAGLPVLCEKPLAVDAAQARAVAAAAERAGVPLIEGFAYRYHPVFDDILRKIAEGAIGSLVSIDSVFTWYCDDRTQIPASAELAGGSLTDVGCYSVHVSRMIAGCEPERVCAFERRTNVDDSMVAILQFPNGIIARFECSIETEERRSLEIKGTRGLIVLDNPWNAGEDEAAYILRRNGRDERIVTPGANVYALEAEDLVRAATTHALPRFPISDSVANMEIMDALALSAKTGKTVSCPAG